MKVVTNSTHGHITRRLAISRAPSQSSRSSADSADVIRTRAVADSAANPTMPRAKLHWSRPLQRPPRLHGASARLVTAAMTSTMLGSVTVSGSAGDSYWHTGDDGGEVLIGDLGDDVAILTGFRPDDAVGLHELDRDARTHQHTHAVENGPFSIGPEACRGHDLDEKAADVFLDDAELVDTRAVTKNVDDGQRVQDPAITGDQEIRPASLHASKQRERPSTGTEMGGRSSHVLGAVADDGHGQGVEVRDDELPGA